MQEPYEDELVYPCDIESKDGIRLTYDTSNRGRVISLEIFKNDGESGHDVILSDDNAADLAYEILRLLNEAGSAC